MTNHSLLTIRFCCAKVVNSTRLCSGGLGRLLGNPNKIPLKIHLSKPQGKFFSQQGVALALSKENAPLRLPRHLCSFISSSTRPYSSTYSLLWICLHIANFCFNRLLISLYNYSCHPLASHRPPRRSLALIKIGRPKDPKNFVESVTSSIY